jgi:tRNA (cmo5U34)-methyltransferase
MNAGAALHRAARDYDRSRRLLIPCFDDFYASALELVPAAAGAPLRVLAAAIERMRHDRPATLEAQLGWLRDVGFRDVHCAYRNGMFAVCAGVR